MAVQQGPDVLSCCPDVASLHHVMSGLMPSGLSSVTAYTLPWESGHSETVSDWTKESMTLQPSPDWLWARCTHLCDFIVYIKCDIFE